MPNKSNNSRAGQLKTLKIIQFALCMSVLIYGVLLYITSLQAGDQAIMTDDNLVIYSVLGVGACFIAMVVNRIGFNPKRLAELKSEEEKLQRLFVVSILTWALAEACAIFGLLSGFLTQDFSQYPLFALLSIFTILAHPFSESRVRHALGS